MVKVDWFSFYRGDGSSSQPSLARTRIYFENELLFDIDYEIQNDNEYYRLTGFLQGIEYMRGEIESTLKEFPIEYFDEIIYDYEM